MIRLEAAGTSTEPHAFGKHANVLEKNAQIPAPKQESRSPKSAQGVRNTFRDGSSEYLTANERKRDRRPHKLSSIIM